MALVYSIAPRPPRCFSFFLPARSAGFQPALFVCAVANRGCALALICSCRCRALARLFLSAIPNSILGDTHVLDPPTGPRVLVFFHLCRRPTLPHSTLQPPSAPLFRPRPQGGQSPPRRSTRPRPIYFLLWRLRLHPRSQRSYLPPLARRHR
jgi:hypothetical protein